MNYISGGVTAPKGFKAAGLHCGVKANTGDKKDLALIVSDAVCTAAGVFTKNQVKAAPIYITKEHLADGTLRGVVANSGNANACAPFGKENAKRMTIAAAQATGLKPEDFAVASTGVIGVTLNIEAVEAGIAQAGKLLSPNGSDDAASAILTTDTMRKEIAVEVELGGKPVRIASITKGSGMIHPNMGTMLSFVTTDCVVDAALLQKMLVEIAAKTFNRITVDGDTSTNDTCLVLANGLAGNPALTEGSADYFVFYEGLKTVCEYGAKKIAADGEGAGRLVTCTVTGVTTEDKAEQMAKAVAGSSLVKAAMFGADANWGRVLCAIGYSGAEFDPEDVEVKFLSTVGEVIVCQKGAGLAFDEETAKQILTQSEVTILVTLTEGDASATCWGCDLTYDYVKINGDYRS